MSTNPQTPKKDLSELKRDGFVQYLTTRLGFLTALILAVGGLLDASFAFFVKTPSVTCHLGFSLYWCPQRLTIEVRALDYWKGTDVSPAWDATSLYGPVLMNAKPWFDRPNAAEWKISTKAGGTYTFEVKYAALEPRPVRVLLNGAVWRESALNEVTGGWEPRSQQWTNLGKITLLPGDNIIRFERDHVFPHLMTLRFSPVDD